MNEINIQSEIVIISDPLLALVLDACCETKSIRTIARSYQSGEACYIYPLTYDLKNALADYEAGKLGDNISASYLLAYSDSDGWGK